MQIRLASVVLLSCSLACSGGRVEDGGEGELEPVKVSPNDLESAVVQILSPKRATTLTSRDGALTVRIQTDTVTRDSALTLAMLRQDKTPPHVVGRAYVLGPSSLKLARPARLALPFAALPAGVEAEDLRLARLDTGAAAYAPAAGQAVLLERGFVAAEITDLGVYALIDAEAAPLVADVPSTRWWEGVHSFERGFVTDALARFAAEHAAAPTADTAFHLALTRLAELPARPALSALLSGCGQPTWSTDALFSPTGYYALEAARSRAEHTLRLAEGYDRFNLIDRRLVPTSLVAELAPSDECLDRERDSGVAQGALRVTIIDPNYDGRGNSVEVVIGVDPVKPLLSSSSTLDQLVAAAPTGAVLPLSDLNGTVIATRSAGDEDDDFGDAPSAGATSTIGSLTSDKDATAGAIVVRRAADALGEQLELELRDVVLAPRWEQYPPQIMVLRGELRATVSEPPSLAAIPFIGLDSPAELFASCDLQKLPLVDEAYLRQVLAEVAAEAMSIAALLDELLARPEIDTRIFDLSLGFLHRAGSMRVGAAELDALAAALKLVGAFERLAAQYHWFTGDFRDFVTSANVPGEPTCPTPCSSGNACTSTLTPRDIFDMGALASALNATAFTLAAGEGDLTDVRALLAEALDHLSSAALRSTVVTPLAFQREAARDGASELVTLMKNLKDMMFADSYLDGVRLRFGDGGPFMHLDDLFVNPPDVDRLRDLGNADPGAALVMLEISGLELRCETSPGVFVDATCDIDCDVPSDRPGCSYECPNLPQTSGELCSQYSYERSMFPNEWLLGAIGGYSTDTGLDCTDDTACSFADGTCGELGSCQFPAYGLDQEALDQLSGTPPAFINQQAISPLDGIF